MLPVLCSAAFLVFAQAFMVAPLIPRLAQVFHSTTSVVGLAVPAYLVPYGVMTLVWGPLSDRIGRRTVIFGSLVLFIFLTAATVFASSGAAFVWWRVATGVGASGVVPISLALIGDLVPFERRGRALGWLFGAMAGGIAVGSTGGALAEPVIGWQGLFVTIAILATALGAAGMSTRAIPRLPRPAEAAPLRTVARGYASLLGQARARRTYAYVLINAVLHSGVYTWLGLYLHQRFGLGPTGIGLALLGYGVPGFVLGPLIGTTADRYGRARLIPLGVAIGAICALGLAAPVPLVAAAVLVTLLSLGYDLTQPLLGGIVTALPVNRGQAMGFNVFTLFVGFGLGSLIFQAALGWGFTGALGAFGAGALVAAVLAVPLFRTERR
ncbi:MAG: MFS transporter [Actinomycetota bacterium]|jgi:predicted MFS family arabinose efflux permease|nr:MFS transporter [Actinomycetota bacterium]MDA8359384.1 MFS transporter [Actinomycetota bacterium]